MSTPAATPSRFQDYQQQLHPTWLQDPAGLAWGASFGAAKDVLLGNAQLAVKCQIIATPTQLPFGPDDSLALNGADRQIDRGQGESSSAYSARVLNAWNIWPFAGTAFGLLKALSDAGYPNVWIVQQLGQAYTLAFDGSGNATLGIGVNLWRWTFDGSSPCLPATQAQIAAWSVGAKAPGTVCVPSPKNSFWYETALGGVSALAQPTWPTLIGATVTDGGGVIWQCKGRDNWSRFGVLFTQPFPAAWGGVPPADNSNEVAKFRKIISRWKPGHGTCVLLAALTGDGTSGQTWDFRPAGATWDTQGRATWDSKAAATYWTPPPN